MTPSFVLFPFNHMIHSDNRNVPYLFSSPKILITKSRKIGEERRGEERINYGGEERCLRGAGGKS